MILLKSVAFCYQEMSKQFYFLITVQNDKLFGFLLPVFFFFFVTWLLTYTGVDCSRKQFNLYFRNAFFKIKTKLNLTRFYGFCLILYIFKNSMFSYFWKDFFGRFRSSKLYMRKTGHIRNILVKYSLNWVAGTVASSRFQEAWKDWSFSRAL